MPELNSGIGNDSESIVFSAIDDSLVVTLKPDINSSYLDQLADKTAEVLRDGHYRFLIMDAAPVELIDSVDFDGLRRVIEVARLMGTRTIIAGLSPGVAGSLIELDANVEGLKTTINLKSALHLVETEK